MAQNSYANENGSNFVNFRKYLYCKSSKEMCDNGKCNARKSLFSERQYVRKNN